MVEGVQQGPVLVGTFFSGMSFNAHLCRSAHHWRSASPAWNSVSQYWTGMVIQLLMSVRACPRVTVVVTQPLNWGLGNLTNVHSARS